MAIALAGALAFMGLRTVIGMRGWDWPVALAIGAGCLTCLAAVLRRRPVAAERTIVDRKLRRIRVKTSGRAPVSISFDEVACLEIRRSEDRGFLGASLILRLRSGRPILVGAETAKPGDTARLDELERQVAEIRAKTGISS